MNDAHILLVDDDPEFNAYVKTKLRDEAPDIHIDIAGTAEDCLKFIASIQPDCIIAGYSLPGMNGMELLVSLRASGSDIPFIFLTGQGNEDVAREAFHNGADDYFTKDVGFAHFSRISNSVQKAINRRREAAATRRAETGLVESESRYRAFLDNFRGIVYQLPLGSHRPDFIHGAVVEMTGYDPEEIVSGTPGWMDIVHPDDRHLLVSEFEKFLTTPGYVSEMEYRITARDGSVRWMRDVARVIDSQDGPLVQGSVCDISPRKQAELALDNCLLILKRVHDADLNFLMGEGPNRLFSELLGFFMELTASDGGMIGEALYDGQGRLCLKSYSLIIKNREAAPTGITGNDCGIDPEQRIVQIPFEQALSTRKPVISNNPLDEPGSWLPWGGITPESFMAIPFRSLYTGELVGLVGLVNRPGGYDETAIRYLGPLISTCTNIIESFRNEKRRCEMAERLRESEARSHEAQRIAHLGYWEWDIIGGDLSWTDEIYNILGVKRDEFNATYDAFMGRVHPDDVAAVHDAVNASLTSNTPYSFEFRVILPYGQAHMVHANGVPVYDDTGRPIRMYGTLQDITERKRFEDNLADRVRHASLGADIGGALTGGGSLREVLQHCAEALVKDLDGAFARIWVYNKDDEMLTLNASAGLYTHTNGPHGRIHVPTYKYKIGIIARDRTPLLSNDMYIDPQVSDKDWVRREGLVSYGGYPLLLNGELVGVMAIFSKKPMSRATFATLASVADEVAVGIKRITADANLNDSVEKLRSLVEESLAGAYILQDERFAYVNPRLAEMLGYTSDELINMDAALDVIVHTDDRHIFRDIITRVIEHDKESGRGRFRCVRKDGAVFYAEALAWGTSYGNSKALIGTMLDVTEMVRTEEALKGSEANLRLILDSVHDAIFIHDLDGAIIDVNEKMIEMYGVDHWQATRLSIADDYSAPDNPVDKLPEIWRRVLAGERANFEWKARRPSDGRCFDAEVYLRRISLSDRDAILANVRDITARKQAEAERAALFQMLTHDIKSPLTIVLGYSDLLRQTLKNEDELSMANGIYNASGRISDLIGDMLEVSRLEAMNELDIEPVRLFDIILKAMAESELPATDRGIAIDVDIEPDLPLIYADNSKLLRAMSNLVSNAVKYNKDGGTVSIKAYIPEDSPHLVQIEVKDSGIGLSEKEQAMVFNKFYRARRSSTKGTGLGLAIVKAIAEAHKGSITVTSREGEGSLFCMSLPMGTARDAAEVSG